jgi:hypothetical protein
VGSEPHELEKEMPTQAGPFVQAACICETLLEDKGGAVSLIRIIDKLTANAAGPNAPETMPAINQDLWLVIMLKSGTALGRHEVAIIPEAPSGERKPPMSLTVHFEGEERGANIFAQIKFTFDIEGLYWFHVELDGAQITSIPFRLRYNRLVTTSQNT